MLRFTDAPPSDSGASVNRSVIKLPRVRIPDGGGGGTSVNCSIIKLLCVDRIPVLRD